MSDILSFHVFSTISFNDRMGSNEKCMVPLEVLAVYEKKLREATIAVQDRLFLQTKEVIEGESFVRILARKI